MTEAMKYYITNNDNRPINVKFCPHPRIQVLKTCCECFSTQAEAQARLDWLREETGKPLKHLKVSTYAKL